MRDLAKVCRDGKLRQGQLGSGGPLALLRGCDAARAAKIAGEGNCFYPAVNASLFKSFEGSGLSVGKARFDAAFGENPTSAAGLNQ
ncbi:MAG: hypothetical protein WCF68_11445 [Terriglobales bacterium]